MLTPQVEGTIPKELRGTLLRNGPGLFEIGNKRIAQPFDGDGMVSILHGAALEALSYFLSCCCCCSGGATGSWRACQ